MDNHFRQQEFGIQQRGGFLIRLQIFGSILNWLAGFIQMTEEEQKDAGIYLGG